MKGTKTMIKEVKCMTGNASRVAEKTERSACASQNHLDNSKLFYELHGIFDINKTRQEVFIFEWFD